MVKNEEAWIEGKLDDYTPRGKVIHLTFITPDGVEDKLTAFSEPKLPVLEVGQTYRYQTEQYQGYRNLKPKWGKDRTKIGYLIEPAGIESEPIAPKQAAFQANLAPSDANEKYVSKTALKDSVREWGQRYGGMSHDAATIVAACIEKGLIDNWDAALKAVVEATDYLVKASKEREKEELG